DRGRGDPPRRRAGRGADAGRAGGRPGGGHGGALGASDGAAAAVLRVCTGRAGTLAERGPGGACSPCVWPAVPGPCECPPCDQPPTGAFGFFAVGASAFPVTVRPVNTRRASLPHAGQAAGSRIADSLRVTSNSAPQVSQAKG